LKENGFAWNEATCAGAAIGGHLELLKWLREQGCPWDWQVLDRSQQFNHRSHVLKWAEENGCTWDGFAPEDDGYNYN